MEQTSLNRNFNRAVLFANSAIRNLRSRLGRFTMTPDPLALQNLPQAAVVVLATLTFALFCWLPAPTVEPATAACERPIFMPTATDGPEYSWQWPLQETSDEEATDEPVRRRHHRRRG